LLIQNTSNHHYGGGLTFSLIPALTLIIIFLTSMALEKSLIKLSFHTIMTIGRVIIYPILV